MKRHGELYIKIYDMDNLKQAHKNARKDKLFYREVKMVDLNEEFYLGQIQEILINKTYVVSEYIISTINDKGKERNLYKLPYFPDRIIQWAILLQTEFIFMKKSSHRNPNELALGLGGHHKGMTICSTEGITQFILFNIT